MSVRLNITKKGKIILLVSLMVLSAGAGGYLLWRTNQSETVSPTDSQAGSSNNGTCWYCCGSSSGVSCPNLTPAQTAAGWACSSGGLYCSGGSLCTGGTVTCGDGVTIPIKSGQTPEDACPACLHAAPGDDEPVGNVECNVGSQCDKTCYWPEVNYCTGEGKCICKSGSDNGCKTVEPCTPNCPSGYEKCSSNCGSDTRTATCTGTCDGCSNKYTNEITCKKTTTTNENTCDSGTWITKPSGTYAHCATIAYSAKGTDSDGIDESTISVKLNNTNRSNFTKSTSGTSTTISETLSSSANCLAAGSYTLDMNWKDKKGASSTNCSLSTTFTVQAEVLNPDWSITKRVAEQCIDENTTNPVSKLTYTIGVKNTGAGTGTMEKIVDTLDTKVQQTEVTNISNGGTFADGKISWNLSTIDKTFVANQEKQFTYVINVAKENFGDYANTVTAYPTEGASITANANITADCVIEAPQTGIFDTTWGKMAGGIVLIFLGFGISKFSVINDSWRRYVISVKDLNDNRRMRNFEKKVVKR